MMESVKINLKNNIFTVSRFCVDFFIGNIEVILFILLLLWKSVALNREIALYVKNPLLFTSSLGALFLFTGLTLWLKRMTRIIVLFFVNVFISVIIVGDMVFYRYFNDVISIPVLMQAVLMDSLQSSIESLFKPIDLYFIIDIILSIPIILIVFRKRKYIKRVNFKIVITSAIVLFLLGASLVFHGFYQVEKMVGRVAFSTIIDHTFFVEKLGIVNFHAFDTYTFAVNKLNDIKGIPNSEKNELKEVFLKEDAKVGVDENRRLRGIAKGKNLIVIQVEALQNLVINFDINGKEVTPNLNRLIKRSMYFSDYYSQTAQGGTSDAEFLSNVSFYPLPEGAVYFQRVNNTYETLPLLMKQEGYNTMVMHAYKGSYWNRTSIYPTLGFNRFFDMKDYNIDEHIGWGLGDKSFLNQSLDKMLGSTKPFYSFIITLSSHYPFDAFKESNEFDAGQFNGTFFGDYLKAIHYTDQALGGFIDKMEKEGILDESVVAIYGDHAAVQKGKLDEVRQYFKLDNDNELAYLDMIRVPLIIHLPHDEEAGEKKVTGGQVDLLPTIANLYGIETRYSMGKDLLNAQDGYAFLRDGSVISNKKAYLKKYRECFDMISGEKIETTELDKYIEMAKQNLYVSDKVLKNNLIPYFERQAGK